MISVLYADDEPDLLELCRIFLEQTGEFRVDTVESAKDALVQLSKTPYDAIVSDYLMPEMDGISLLKSVRERDPDIPFILFTGRGREEVVIEAVNNGADFFIQKGGDPKARFVDLMHQVRQAVNKRRAERDLRESEKRLTDIINFLPDPTFAIDREGKVIAWNLAIEELTGIPAAEMLGKGDHEYAIPFYGHRRPTLIDLPFEPDQEIPDQYTGIRHTNKTLIAETDLPHPRGKQLTLMGKTSPLYDREGKIAGAIESIRDITARKQEEDELRFSESQYRSIIENMQDMLYRTDMDGKITMINPAGARIAGYDSAEEMIGLDLAQVLYAHPQERKKFLAVIAREGSVNAYPLVLKDRKGHRYHVCASSHYYKDSHGHVLGIEGIIHNLTDIRHAEETLKEANRKLNLLNSITRHDVANQLTVLQGYAYLAMMKNPDPMIGDFLKKIDAVCATIGRQIEFSKEYQELGVHAPDWFSLEDIFAKNKPRDILFSSSCTGTEIFADPMLENVFANLFSNSIMHGEWVSQITVRCEPKGDDLQITVEDNGVGIPLDLKQNIFRKGFGKNTGFGLFLAREILAITGISIYETGKHGSGARFELTVPNNGFRCSGDPESRNA
jgi:PAS domain S-box-containing protein